MLLMGILSIKANIPPNTNGNRIPQTNCNPAITLSKFCMERKATMVNRIIPHIFLMLSFDKFMPSLLVC